MANTKEIKTRIESVKDTRKITNAMYLIASTKRAKHATIWTRTRPYFEALRTEIKRIFRTQNDVDSRYFYPPEGEPPLRAPTRASSSRRIKASRAHTTRTSSRKLCTCSMSIPTRSSTL